jgi:hypothetical protein
MRKRNQNNIAARSVGPRKWRDLMDPRKWQGLTGHRQVNLMGRPQVSPMGHLQGRA